MTEMPSQNTAELPHYVATDLTKGGGIAYIEHEGQLYILRVTKTGKLILTK
ncbi:MAG: hemin uptake protein HemP [Pseudomonadota bacterium]